VTFAEFVELASSERRWDGITRLPWDDEAFSRRMLREHLSQLHDGASRRFETIDKQVRWIHEHVLGETPSRVLDLGCGPGLYTQRLAALGHRCTGIDLAPASIEYARRHASGEREHYVLGDIANAPLGSRYDLVMLIHGEFNVLARDDASLVLQRVRSALRDGGRMLLEVHPRDAVRAIGGRPRAWLAAAAAGLFGDERHLRLDESRWDGQTQTACNLHWIFDSQDEVRRYGTVTHAYSDDEYDELLHAVGFSTIERAPSLDGGGADANYAVLIASL
jgi:SAM-dependent methyltransferase